jgi:DNA-directed RNA polymerase subunit RPC12/RpoP
MELLSVRCNHCGAPLQIPADARFVTCTYCQSELTVQRNEGTICTEVLQRIEQKTDRMADNLDVIRIQGDIELLDREWQMKRETMLIRDRRGKLVEPGGTSPLAGCAIAIFAAPLFMVMAVGSVFSKNNDAAPFLVLIVIAAVVVSVAKKKKSSPYKTALAEYEQRRAVLMQQLGEQSRAR